MPDSGPAGEEMAPESDRGWSSEPTGYASPDPDAEPEERAGDGDGPGEPSRLGGFATELPVLILIAFVLAILMKTFLVQAFYIPSSSMEPTLLINDRVLVNKLSYTFREPRRGEIVVFSERAVDPQDIDGPGFFERLLDSLRSGIGLSSSSQKDFIKRVIGLPGEMVEMREGVVYVDGVAIEEAPTSEGGYLSARDLTDFGPTMVPDDHYFMMGDNRPSSADSRSSLGTIHRDELIGRAFVLIWPFGRATTLPIPDYPGVPDSVEAAEDEETLPLPLAS